MRTLIYGGSFNPPHIGHVEAVRSALKSGCCDRVIVMPSGTPPHKILPEGSPDNAERLRLCELAFGVLPGVEVSDLEIASDGVDYTIDTVEALQKQYPEDEIALLVGTDMFLTLENWYDGPRLLENRRIWAMPREKGEKKLLRAHAAHLHELYGTRAEVLKKTALPVSSTEIRAALPQRGGTDKLPEQVYAEVIRKRWYGAKPSLEWLRTQAYAMLKPKRIPHVQGCEEMAVKLAERWGEDCEQAAESAILHDITKKNTADDQLRLCDKYGIMTDNAEREQTQLLHAKTGACVARDCFGVDEAVYNAICWHTTARENMTDLEKIIYLADAMEPNRSYSGVEKLRELAFENLDEAMILGLQMSIETVLSRGQEVFSVTEKALAWFRKQKEEIHDET